MVIWLYLTTFVKCSSDVPVKDEQGWTIVSTVNELVFATKKQISPIVQSHQPHQKTQGRMFQSMYAFARQMCGSTTPCDSCFQRPRPTSLSVVHDP